MADTGHTRSGSRVDRARATDGADIGDAIAAAQGCFIRAKPWYRPAEPDGRSEVVHVVVPERYVRIGRILSHELDGVQIAALGSNIPVVFKTAAGIAET